MATISTIHFLPHQTQALEKLHSGCILCAGVGTGKSITALGYYYINVCDGVVWDDGTIGPMTKPKDLYIITTARKRDTHEWESECEKFGCDIQKMRWPEGGQVTIDSWNNLHKYIDVSGAVFIFDEQRVVGRGAWTKAFWKVSRKNLWLLLSATPGDSWADYIPVFVANGFYANATQFLRRHAVYSRYCTRYPKIERWLEVAHLESLRRRITVTMRYEKPTERHYIDISVGYDAELYAQVAEKRWDPWKNEPVRDAGAACYLMRRVVNSEPDRARQIVFTLLSKHPRVIVFYNFDYELELLKETFDAMLPKKADGSNDISVAEWNGHRHEPLPKTKRWAYLVQYNAGAEGWNCTQTNAIMFYSQNYSYKMMEQAAGRIDRMNTDYSDLYYYTIKCDAPIDQAISRALRGKKNFNEKNFIKW